MATIIAGRERVTYETQCPSSRPERAVALFRQEVKSSQFQSLNGQKVCRASLPERRRLVPAYEKQIATNGHGFMRLPQCDFGLEPFIGAHLQHGAVAIESQIEHLAA